MAFNPQQLQDITTMMEEHLKSIRPEPEIRHQLDIGWRHDGQSVYLYEIRPQWNDETIIRHYDYAKATWVEKRKLWKIFWLRASLKWEAYEPLLTVGNLQRFLIEVEKDPLGAFKG
ncbi:MAG: DUF3024 domain-containing protein [Flavisolibacter sp.]|jgi:hypothetical protein|nr:DUF3024 domain-containing protein [Flavisolibacter sp.]